jgi:nucleoside-diphosphate-sugar epimerase
MIAQLFSYQFDEVYHLASMIGAKGIETSPADILWTNQTLMDNAIVIARLSNAKFLYVSTAETYYCMPRFTDNPVSETSAIGFDDPRNPRWAYAFSKVSGEAELAHTGLNYFIAKPTNLYGPRMTQDYVIKKLIEVLKSDKQATIGNINDTREYLYVEDLVKGLITLMSKDWDNQPNKTVLFPGRKPMTVVDLINEMAYILEVKSVPKLVDSEIPEKRHTSGKKAKDWLKWEPKTSISEGLRKTIEFYA